MSLQTRLSSLITAVGTDIKTLYGNFQKTDAVALYSGGAYPLRNTVTTDTSRRVRWVGPSAPTIGGGYAITGLDIWESTLANVTVIDGGVP